VSHRPSKFEAPPPISVARTAIAGALVALGIAVVATYTVIEGGDSLGWMQDLGKWNYLIGFGLVIIGLGAFSHRLTPLGRGRGVVWGMLGCFLLGLAWIVVYYFTSNRTDIPLISDLGNYNLVVGIAFMAVGFVFATKWE
jgi:hypothetical protein